MNLELSCANGNDLCIYLDADGDCEFVIDDAMHRVYAPISLEQLTLLRDALSSFLTARTRST